MVGIARLALAKACAGRFTVSCNCCYTISPKIVIEFIAHLDKISVIFNMNYDIINSLVTKGFSTRKISTELKTSQSNVRYWLKKFNIKTTSRSKVSDYRHCPRCETEKLKTEFYNRRNGKGNSVYCKLCSHTQTLERQRDFKQRCVDHKGGKCICCGYDKTNNALDFHHLNPSEKDFSISSARFTTFDNRVINELNKCALVCRNCHAEIHAGIKTLQ